MSNPSPTPADRLAGIVAWIIRVLDTHSMYGKFPRPLAMLITTRVIAVSQLFRRIAERVAAGTFRPRRRFTRKPSANQKPPATNNRANSPLPTEARWLTKLLPETAGARSQLQALLAAPEMAAVLQAAPGPLRRPLRSLCRMLGVEPPPILALPPRPRPVRAQPAPEARPRPALPDWPPRTRLGFYQRPPTCIGHTPDRKRAKKTS